MANKDKKFFDWAYIENAAKYFYGMDRIHLTGGEPTLHPKFAEFVPKLKKLFGCNRLTIETNGFGFKKHSHLFGWFDEIYCSHYTKDTFEGCPDNTEEIVYLRDILQILGNKHTKTIVGEVQHTPRENRGTKICARGTSETLGYSNGKLYPCCVASGLPAKDVGIPLTENWRKEILDVIHPCDICFFALK